jgi:hypothetical protein
VSRKKETSIMTRKRNELNLGKGASLFLNGRESESVG